MERARARRGSAILEFTFCGIPLIFVTISIVQMAIGMWNYDTLQYATKAAGAYLQVHGSNSGYCLSNTCQIQNIASVFANNANGIPQTAVTLTFTPVSSVDHLTKGTATTCTLNNCLTNTTTWPVSGYNTTGSEFEIGAEYQFFSALSMFAPGSTPVSFGSPWFPSYTHQTILF